MCVSCVITLQQVHSFEEPAKKQFMLEIKWLVSNIKLFTSNTSLIKKVQ